LQQGKANYFHGPLALPLRPQEVDSPLALAFGRQEGRSPLALALGRQEGRAPLALALALALPRPQVNDTCILAAQMNPIIQVRSLN
jgi:hypothetical protein